MNASDFNSLCQSIREAGEIRRRNAPTATQQAALDKMQPGHWYKASDLGISQSTLRAMVRKRLVRHTPFSGDLVSLWPKVKAGERIPAGSLVTIHNGVAMRAT